MISAGCSLAPLTRSERQHVPRSQGERLQALEEMQQIPLKVGGWLGGDVDKVLQLMGHSHRGACGPQCTSPTAQSVCQAHRVRGDQRPSLPACCVYLRQPKFPFFPADPGAGGPRGHHCQPVTGGSRGAAGPAALHAGKASCFLDACCGWSSMVCPASHAGPAGP